MKVLHQLGESPCSHLSEFPLPYLNIGWYGYLLETQTPAKGGRWELVEGKS